MQRVRQAVGKSIAEWDDAEPLRWRLHEERSDGKHTSTNSEPFDLTVLRSGYREEFLLALKDLIVNGRRKRSLRSCTSMAYNLRRLLQISQEEFSNIAKEQKLTIPAFERIDGPFLVGLNAICEKIPRTYFETLRLVFKANRENGSLFAPDIAPGDFPTRGRGGATGRLRKNIISTALSRATLVHILNVTESAFDAGKLDLARYAFSRLMLSRAARPETYRELKCRDLEIDEASGVKHYFLSLPVPKASAGTIRPKARVKIHADVGQLLEKQRESVASQHGHLIAKRNDATTMPDGMKFTIGDLALFPMMEPQYASFEQRLGALADSSRFTQVYVVPLKKLTKAAITCTALRHTMGTQLAISKCSAATIGAVLLHATNMTAKVYVDLFFEGAIDALSDALEPAFAEHFPVFNDFISIREGIEPEKRIVSVSSDRSRRQTTGECGRHQICQYAPIACYECTRFRPAYDADHSINLDRVNHEIALAENGGLQRQTDVRRWKHIANRIRVVIHICELKSTHVASANSHRAGRQ